MAGRLPKADITSSTLCGLAEPPLCATVCRSTCLTDVKGHKRNFCGLYKLEAVEELSATDTFELVIVPVKHCALPQTLKEIVPKQALPSSYF
jgi:hypothetical protein